MSGHNCPPCTESWAADECLPCWDVPDFKCDCLDLSNADHLTLWQESWRVASSYVFNATGQQWPGKCITETVRPCVPRSCPSSCGCYDCGRYDYLPIEEAFCWPIHEVTAVTISPNPCQPDGAIWTNGAGFRLERVMGKQRLVIEDTDGHCPTFPRQSLSKPMGEPCTWSITAITGCNPPPEVLRGTAALACDIAQESIRTKCGLPRSVTSASFNGVSVSYDKDRGKTIDLQMLREVIDRHPAKPVEQFLNHREWVRYHHIDGPRRRDDITPVVPEPVVDDCAVEFEPDPAVTENPNSLGIYSVSPVS